MATDARPFTFDDAKPATRGPRLAAAARDVRGR